ncbi:signal peptidase II [Shimia thalassica]|uniref:signal peptidase II n=1 Tax=Shimia thalassica TaxID=1715693 RepID=UPI0027373C07|nr:signal peptidase II [Shimia thalassica]MDP2520579.1 signal peptidase II [Shimia thalassica]MDP2582045.1 signal peptidase II [Shimia thalassica]
MRNSQIGLFSTTVTLFLDQVTKMIVVENAPVLARGIQIFPGFDIVFFRNDGVTFGMLAGFPWWGLTLLALSICCWLVLLLLRSQSRLEAYAYGAIIGGALGNALDRIRFQAVTDFLDFSIKDLHWPAFNLADGFVVGGVVILLLAPILRSNHQA